jgi:hypothetical protein
MIEKRDQAFPASFNARDLTLVIVAVFPRAIAICPLVTCRR